MKAQRGGFVLGLVVGLLLGLAVALGVALYITKTPVPFIDKVPPHSPEADSAEAARNRNWDPNASLSTKPPAGLGAASAPASGAAASGPEPFVYFVQAGAFSRPEDAEQQRARLGLLGQAAKVSERDQAGRTVFRVRIGPFDARGDADALQARLQAEGVDARIVRVARP
ncbi:MAG: SPOR domain-containing protein [Burkholderiales bacterium]|nr:SPOR domain-containing protein [Burkholderiales bacterium]